MFKKILSICACLAFVLFTFAAHAQTGTLTGTVIDQSSGESLPGVNILIEELERGGATDVDGEFEITDIEPGTYTVRATFVGYEAYVEEVTIDEGTTELEIPMVAEMQELDDVVVTAMGMSREQQSISYSVQEVSGEDLSLANSDNIVGSLAGKASGVQVIGSPGANLGGSEKIRIRGANGLSDEQPLFVVDGTPISNESFSQAGGGRDYGNLAQDLNIDDIESVSVLKGASASALYGNRASGGVVVITTKGGETGERPLQVNYSNSTTLDNVYILPEYQNEYAGGYTQSLIEYEDPETGETYEGLNYAADESWGPRMEGQMYRPWWSWFHGDFTGDGEDDYGTEIPLEPNPDNVRNFYDTGVRVSNSLAINGGSENSSYRVSIEDSRQNGVIPNSSLDRTYLNFNGALDHSDKFSSRITFNYVNTQTEGRPAQGYSPAQGNPTQSFNQWFQRQLSMDELQNYELDDGTLASWNIQSPSNVTPLYWDSPYFSIYENVPQDDRDRVYGNYTLSYQIAPNLEATGRIHADMYDFVTEDRIATGGLETDWFSITQRSRREMNYEGSLQYQRDFGEFTFDGFLGANLRQENYSAVSEETVGGLSSSNLFNIEASINRPDVTNTKERREVRSIYGTANLGWRDMLYGEITLRNDWSSTLPEDDNSYLYYGFSGNFTFTELDLFDNQDFLTYGKLRASIAQVGQDVDPYRVTSTYDTQIPRGSYPALLVPNTRPNPNLRAAISSDYELGADLRFYEGRLRLDGTYYQSVKEDEILDLEVSSASGYNSVLVNAGEFTTKGWELQLAGTPIQTEDWNLDLTVNWATYHAEVNELAEGLSSRLLEQSSFYAELYAREGEEWGKIVSYGYARDEETGDPIFNPETGGFVTDVNVDHGSILPDWNGGFRTDISYKNFTLGAFIEFQKGGQFYSISKMFNNYSGLGAATVGENELGNPLRDPVVDQDGNTQTAVPLDEAGENSGGVLVEGSDGNGNDVQYLSNPVDFFYTEFINQERYLYDASYIKLREVKLTYNLPADFMEQLPLSRASIAVHAQNPWLLYASTDGVDPSIIQNGTTGFSWWEGGGVPGTRSVGFDINLGF